MNEWERVSLSEVVDRITEKNVGGHDRVMTVAAGRGLVDQETYFSKRVASKDLSTYYVLQDGDFVYNKSTSVAAPFGVVARYSGEVPGVVTPLYFAFRAKSERVMPEYLLLAANGLEFFQSLAGKLREGARAHGLLNVRLAEFYGATLPLPPMDEQRRIVDVIAAVDAQEKALAEELERLVTFLQLRRSDLVNDRAIPAVRAEEAFEFSTGVRRTPDRANGPSMTPYLRSANVGYGVLDLSDVQEMNYEPHERVKFGLRFGDVLVSEGSASAKAVGMPAMWRDELPAPVCFQMTLLRLRAVDGMCLPDFAFHWCMWAYESGAFLDVAGGTSIKHISAKRSSQMPVRLPSLERQYEIVTELKVMDSEVGAVRAELAHLRNFRSALLGSVLARDLEIPESFVSRAEKIGVVEGVDR